MLYIGEKLKWREKSKSWCIEAMDKYKNLFRSLIIRVWYKSHISGRRSIINSRGDYLKLAKNSKLILNGFLALNVNKMGKNGRSSILRMDEDSVLECNGFGFMYGADIILFKGAHLILGKGSFINSDCKIRCYQEITIGEGCAISHDFTVMDSDAHQMEGSRNMDPVHIGNHVWIGTRVTILKGVTVGDGAVIAAGALVVKDVPEGSLVGGVPAKVIKEKVEWKA